jgi:high-affinity iron transporter
MLGSAIIVFRETLEAALIVGIIAAATRQLPARNRWLLTGVVAGVLGACVVAALTGRIAELAEGSGQEYFNAGVLGLAAAMLAWHNIWMARHGKELAQNAMRVGSEVREGRREMSALALVVTLAILREGSETALFLYGLSTGGETLSSVLGGGAAGLALGALAGVGLYAGFVRIPTRYFFAVTSGLVLLLAAAMASQAARFLTQADLLPPLATPLWDSSWLLPDGTTLGRALHTLIGYEATPSGIQVLFYVGTFVLILVGMRLCRVGEEPRGKPASV